MNCPHCTAKLNVAANLTGKRVKCPKCNGEFVASSIQNTGESKLKSSPPLPPPTNQPQRPHSPPDRKSDAVSTKFSWFTRHRRWSGTRSFIFQTILFAWTVFMLLVGFGLFLMAADIASDSIKSPYLSERRGSAGAFFLSGICCPLGVYFLLAIPLGIAAIATLESNKT